MSDRFAYSTALLLTAVALLFTCTDLPVDPMQDTSNSSIKLFLKEDSNPVVDFGTTHALGLEIRLTHLLDSIRVYSECVAIDTQFAVDSTNAFDTVWFNLPFETEGECRIDAEATMRNAELRNRTSELSIHVLAEKPGIHFVARPPACTLTTDKTDTLLFVTRVTGGADIPASYTLTISPEEGTVFFTSEYSAIKDTVQVITSPGVAGNYEIILIAASTYKDNPVADTATVTVTAKDPVVPSVVHAPKQLIAGKADTLVFAVDNSTRTDPLTISLLVDPPLDSSVFTILPTGADSIVIAVSENAAPSPSATIGIITGNATESDTSWYPVTIINPEATLWNTTSLELDLIEGTPFTLNLSEYISVADMEDISLSADVGTIEDNVWSITPAWGCAEALSATITAIKGDISPDLLLTLSVVAGDEVKPVVALVDETLDGKKVSSSQITVECEVTDVGAGVDEVVFSSGEQIVTATLQSDDVYSGVIDGLEHAVPAQITITATDGSRAKNTGTLTFTITRDTTMRDGESPSIVQTDGPASGDRVQSSEGSLVFTISDDSGVDSIWWTLNDVFVAAVAASDNGYTVSYGLAEFGENVIKLYAKDGSSSGNEGSKTITLNYNTQPTAITLTTPVANAIDVSTTPTFEWSGGEDPDGDNVTVTVNYGTSQEQLTNTASVTGTAATISDELEYNTAYFWQVTGTSASAAYPDTVQSGVGSFTTEGSLPTISEHPAEQTKEEEQSAMFSVTADANGFGELSYQWREDGSPVGGNSSSYTIESVTTAMDGNMYDCIVSNDVGSTTSNAATLTVDEIPTFTVSFWTENATPKPNDQTVRRDEYANKPTEIPLRNGYIFTDWYIEGASSAFNFSGTKITDDLQLVAGWVQVFSVTYHNTNADGGNVPIDANKYESGETVTVAGNTGNLYRNEYNFTGWTTSSDGSGTVFTTLPISSSDIHLYPKWEQTAFTVTYNANGGDGTVPTDPNSYTNHNNLVTIMPNQGALIKGSQSFAGWSTINGATYLCGQQVTINGDLQLYAKYSTSDIMDNDGNLYTSVVLDGTRWLTQNLKTTKYRDGSSIAFAQDSADWVNRSSGTYCWQTFNITTKVYGALYDWTSVQTGQVAPAGWRIPTEAEWTALFNIYGVNEGCPYVAEGTAYWDYDNCSSATNTNITGFSAMANGYMGDDGRHGNFRTFAYWWVSTGYSATIKHGMGWTLGTCNAVDCPYPETDGGGVGIRCVKE